MTKAEITKDHGTADLQWCIAQTVDWSRCERPATRTIAGAAWNGEDGHFCAQHAKLHEKAMAKRAAKQ